MLNKPCALNLILCPGGGTGRRAGFRYLWPLGHGSSSLLLGTNTIWKVFRITTVSKQIKSIIPRGTPTSIEVYKDDIPDHLEFGSAVAVDTEAQGLNYQRDRLCTAQLSDGNGICHIVQFSPKNYKAKNLKALLINPKIKKIFHYARFDIVILKKYLDVSVNPIFCTKIASKIVRTYTSSHGLKDITRELLNIDLSKQQQSSDWAATNLTQEQILYAANDVLNLNLIYEKLLEMLKREKRLKLAQSCFDFLETRGELDLSGWAETDIFDHK